MDEIFCAIFAPIFEIMFLVFGGHVICNFFFKVIVMLISILWSFMEDLCWLTGNFIIGFVSAGYICCSTQLKDGKNSSYIIPWTFCKRGKRYLHSNIVMAIGLLFWILLTTILILYSAK